MSFEFFRDEQIAIGSDDFFDRLSVKHYEDPHQNFVSELKIKNIGNRATKMNPQLF